METSLIVKHLLLVLVCSYRQKFHRCLWGTFNQTSTDIPGGEVCLYAKGVQEDPQT